MDLQELISRGRFIFANANSRLEVFKSINKNTAADIAKKVGRSLNSVLNDLKKLVDLELIFIESSKKNGKNVYIKNPLIKHIPLNYFTDYIKSQKAIQKQSKERGIKQTRILNLNFPSEQQILDICKSGETQVYEFKQKGIEIRSITKEIAAFLNTKQGGIIFYGVEDDGTISGSDLSHQRFDQSLQNSVRHTIKPSASIKIKSVKVLGYELILVLIPGWNKKDVFEYEGRVYIRKGTNVFEANIDEKKKLHKGQFVE